MKKVMVWTGAGQIGMAIARRMGYGMKIVVGDKKIENAKAIADIMNGAGYDVTPVETDLSERDSILELIDIGKKLGDITMLVNAAGVSPSQAPVESILKVDLYGTAVLLEEVGKVIAEGGVGVTISSQSGHRMPALTAQEDEQLACTPTEELLSFADFAAGKYPRHSSCIPACKEVQRKARDGGVCEVGREKGAHQFHISRNHSHASCN